MVLYGITLVPLAEELRAADMGLLLPFNADDAAFDGSEQRSAHLLNLLMKRGTDRLSPSSSWTNLAKMRW